MGAQDGAAGRPRRKRLEENPDDLSTLSHLTDLHISDMLEVGKALDPERFIQFARDRRAAGKPRAGRPFAGRPETPRPRRKVAGA